MTLKDAHQGKRYIVEAVLLPEGLKRRLSILGMTAGSCVELIRKKYSGAEIISIRGARYAIGRKISENVLVSEKNAEGGDNSAR